MQSAVGAIGLECLMNRANIFFTSGYRFAGPLDVAALEASFHAIADATEKFEYRLHFEAQNRFAWRHAGKQRRRFRLIDCDDLDDAFAELCRGIVEETKLDGDHHHPMALAVLRQRGSDEFLIAQTSEHTYVDARSAEFLFNRMVAYYNAMMRGDRDAQHDIVASVRRVRTLGSGEMLKVLGLDDGAHERNLQALSRYPLADEGGYAIPLEAVEGCLHDYRKQRFAPIVRFLPLARLLERCRRLHPEVTQNSVICAALVKGMYLLNRQQRQLPESQTISFKMLSDLLAPDLRAQYAGNYIAFVPVSVDGSLPIEEIAFHVHRRIREFKEQKIDASLFRAVEDAVQLGVVGTAHEPLSFIVTNWNNYDFLNTDDFLHGCTSLRHQSGVNIDPRDTLGAVLVNRPVMVINLATPDEVCLSFFPSLRNEAENRALADSIGELFPAGD